MKMYIKSLSQWTKNPVTPTNIWLLFSVEKGTISIHSRVKWPCSRHGYLSAPATISSVGNMTPWWTRSFLPLFQRSAIMACCHSLLSLPQIPSVSVQSSFQNSHWVWKRNWIIRYKKVTNVTLSLASVLLYTVTLFPSTFVTSNLTHQKENRKANWSPGSGTGVNHQTWSLDNVALAC